MKMNSKNLKSNSRVAIINRGEAAVRFIKAVKEFNILKNTNISTVAFFMESDRNSPFVKKADLAIALSSLDGYYNLKTNPYLNREFIIKAILGHKCDSVWGGWGFLSEDHQFVEMLEHLKIVFIGPTSSAMKLLGDKITAKKVAFEAKVPILPWSEGPIIDLEDAKNWGKKIGYPVILKAANGGGGRGIRFVKFEDELAKAFESVLAETKRITGNEIVFMEALIEEGRHLEVQIAADQFSNVKTFGVRDCSVQRNNQKIIEETPPYNLDSRLMQLMEDSSKELIRMANYSGVATVEFIYDVKRAYPYFMEVNTRLQVEHPITEQIFGIDLVKMQLAIAMGEEINCTDNNTSRGVSIEVRLNAEDAEKNFIPSPGLISHLIPPTGAGIRFDSGVEQDCTISSEFDSMIAKIIAWSPNRKETISRLISALDELEIKIEKGTTNRAFLKTLLLSESFQRGGVNTAFVKNLLQQSEGKLSHSNSNSDSNSEQKLEINKAPKQNIGESSYSVIKKNDWHLAIIVAAIHQYEERYLDAFSNFMINFKRYSTPRNIFLENLNNITIPFRGKKYQFHIRRTPKGHYHIQIDDVEIVVRYFKMGPSATLFVNDNKKYVIQIIDRNDFLQCEIDGIPYPIELDCQGVVRSHIPAMVLSINVKIGDLVKKGDLLLLLEAMKMEMPVLAVQDGRISSMSIRPGEQVKAGQILFEIESEQQNSSRNDRDHYHDHDTQNSSELSFVELSVEKNLNLADKKWEILKREFLSVFSGHDYNNISESIHNSNILSLIDKHSKQYPEIIEEYVALLWNGVKNYIVVERLFSKEKLLQKENARSFNYQDYLKHYFLRDVDREKGLPEKFLNAMAEAIKLYTINDVNKTQMTRHALFRLYQSHAQLKHKEILLLNSLLKIKDLYKNDYQLFIKTNHTEKESSGQQYSKYLADLIELTRESNHLLADTASHLLFGLKILKKQEDYKNKSDDDKNSYPFIQLSKQLNFKSILKKNNNFYLNQLIYSNKEIIFELLDVIDLNTCDKNLLIEILTIKNNKFLNESNLQIKHLAISSLINCHEDLHLFFKTQYEILNTRNGHNNNKLDIKKYKTKYFLAYIQFSDSYHIEEYNALVEKYNWGLHIDNLTIITILANKQSIINNINFNDKDNKGNFSNFNNFYIEPYKEKLFNIELLKNFNITFLKKYDFQYFYFLQAITNKKDERFFAFLELPELSPSCNEYILEAVHEIRLDMARMKKNTLLNRIIICFSKVISNQQKDNFLKDITKLFNDNKKQFASDVIDQYIVYYNCGTPIEYELTEHDDNNSDSNNNNDSDSKNLIILKKPATKNKNDNSNTNDTNGIEKREIRINFSPDMKISEHKYQEEVLRPLSEYENKISKCKQQSHIFPYEFISKLGDECFEEMDLDQKNNTLISVNKRSYGMNFSNVVVGIISHQLPQSKILCKRVLIIGDPSRDYGSLAEGECKIIIAAIDLAEKFAFPIEWIPFSSGARIDIKSGTENLDWTAAVLKRIINFTQNGGEINIIVDGVNVGAQSYWNAEATMLMHTSGLLIMTEKGSMLLTGKKALEYSGSVSAEDNISIGGVEKIMGPNGESQFQVKDIDEAYKLLFNHYELTYKTKEQHHPVRWATKDSFTRNINNNPYDDFVGQGLKTIGDILGTHLNAERKRPFDIRQVMKSVIDEDAFYLERWGQMENAETAVTWQTRIGGHAVGLIGIESRPLKRLGEIPNDGPDIWTGGTLFPMSSKKVARAINAFSNKLPLVVLANLSGFDGSPESLRNHQLEFGAEIGRAVVNFNGPIIFVVIARYHGGAYVVFSKRLNKNIKVLALKNTFASVIGGGAAAAVVFPRIISDRTLTDSIVKKAQKDLQAGRIDRTTYDKIYQDVESNNQLQLAKEFDQIHSIERAKEVGSIDEIIESKNLRPRIIELLDVTN